MLKKHKMLLELVAKKETPMGAISLSDSINLSKSFWKTAEKFWFECFMKGYPKEVLDYKPTGKTYKIKTLEDIAKLTPEQFEFLIEDLRNWCNLKRNLKAIEKLWIAKIKQENGMTWLDTWLHEAKVEANFQTSNKF